ncbi:MAG: cytidylate kinase-like family protein [Eubacterium sp.]|nr:cytidylate kinase-like family protein [Eubacterium sp.]
MEKQLIISVSREYASGGHKIAELIAKHYDIPLHDKNMLDEIAAEKGVDLTSFAGADEKTRNVFTSRTVNGYNNSAESALANMQFDFLRERAMAGDSFVVCGRCSDYILKDNENLIKVFIIADEDVRYERACKVNECSVADAIKIVEKSDKRRREYHNQYCKTKWGDARNYDLCINSTRMGIEKTAEALIDYIDKRRA